jgi:hypothetical protein
VEGVCPACPDGGGEEGEGGRGGIGTSTLVTCLGSQGTLCPCSPLMTRVGRPWTLLLLLVGPGPISLMHSARSNKSSSEGDTPPMFSPLSSLLCLSSPLFLLLSIHLSLSPIFLLIPFSSFLSHCIVLHGPANIVGRKDSTDPVFQGIGN